MTKRGDLLAELRRWFFSVLIFMPLAVGPAIAWQVHLLYDIAQRAGSPDSQAAWSSFFILGEYVLLSGLLILTLHLWHWPTMLTAIRSTRQHRAPKSAYPIFIVTLAIAWAIVTWQTVEGANCRHKMALPRHYPVVLDYYPPFWEDPCAWSQSLLLMLAAYFVVGLFGLVILRFVVLLVAPWWKARRGSD